ncbi:MAG: Na/Pi cotransporter family protein [Oscillospiraceae bacterium]|nr:Na/Pi cotransporter family protein [Oscillospiraceae bacterium]
MTIFNIIALLGGLALFLYGMHAMSSGLEKLSGGRLEKTIYRMTSNPLTSLLLGAGITIAIQSSSATTVMLVGLVNSGVMQLEQTIGVIMGSNIGTTLTAWILSLAGIDSSSIGLNLLKPENFAPIAAFIGMLMAMLSKKRKRQDIGYILAGFGVLMFGMTLMSSSVSPLKDSPSFTGILTAFENPFLGIIVGAIFTGIIQSSAASVGIMQALSLTGGINYAVAMPIIMGVNIGTCVTSLISTIGVNKNAKRVAFIHFSIKIIGTIICMILYYIAKLALHPAIFSAAASPWGIALCHTIFNILTTIILYPFSRRLVKLSRLCIRDKNEIETYAFLDERLINTPSFAISECHNRTCEMAILARDTFIDSIQLNKSYSPRLAERIKENEDRLDEYEDKLGTFLVKISSKDLSDSDSKEVSKQLHTIGDFERIGDHAINMVRTADERFDKSIAFSDEANGELAVISSAVTEILTITTKAFEDGDLELAGRVEPLEQVIDSLIAECKSNHVRRLRNGACTIELGFVLSDLLTNYSRVSDHCSNIAVALIEVAQNAFDTHEYLGEIKSMDNPEFKQAFDEYMEKYRFN